MPDKGFKILNQNYQVDMLALVQKVHLIDQCIMLWGLTEEEIYQPFIGVATTWNESAPCNITPRKTSSGS